MLQLNVPAAASEYPTPRQPAVQTFARSAQYQPVMQAPTQTFIQTQPFVSAPQFAPTQSYAQPYFAPAMQAPIQQTFASQPAIASPIQTIQTPQYFPQPLGTPFPANNYYAPQTAIISSTPIVEAENTAEDMNSEVQEDGTERVQEGQIEGELVSPEDENFGSITPTKEVEENLIPLLPEETKSQAAKRKAKELEAEEAEAAKEKAAKEKAAKEKAAKEKAAKEKAAKAANRKSSQGKSRKAHG